MTQERQRIEHWTRLPIRCACPSLHRGRRSGVTVLEVLFAIGIATVGLLGVLLIVPLAGMRVTRGTMADNGDRLGRNAIRSFDVFQMRRPLSWAQLTNSAMGTYAAYTGGEGFCLDPLCLANNAGTAGSQYFPAVPDPPYSGATPPTGEAWMKRITLRSVPGGALTSVMSVRQAEQVFMGDDDLVFSLPANDRTAPPEQKFSEPGNTKTKRQSQGAFSWMATLTPKMGATSDLYVLSVVVFHRRVPELSEERVSEVKTFDSSGINGGEVVLQTISGGSDEDLKMKEGEWLMLFGRDTNPDPDVDYFRWYQIQTADAGPRDVGSSTYERDLTLFGQDWPSADVPNPKVVWIPGTIAVYEKTIRLETSSMWTAW